MKSNTKYLVVVVLLVVLVGVYYYANRGGKSSTVSTTENTSDDTTSIVGENASTENMSTENQGDLVDSADTTDAVGSLKASVASSADIASYNQAMSDAQKAFGKGDNKTAIRGYTNAIRYSNTDVAHAGLYVTYSSMQRWSDAFRELNKAIDLNPLNSDYWRWKMTLVSERVGQTYQAVKAVYEDSLKKVDPKTKVNVVTHFAGMAEKYGNKADAVGAWQLAIALLPEKTSVYQAEINSLMATQ